MQHKAIKLERSPKTGRKYCFQMKTLIVAPDSRQALLNQYVHRLMHQTVAVEDDIYIALSDLVRIYSPEWTQEDVGTVLFGTEQIRFEADHRNVWYGDNVLMLKMVPFEKEGCIYVPLAETMQKIFGQYVFRLGRYVGVSACEADSRLKFDAPSSKELTAKGIDFRLNKTRGDMYDTVWIEEEQRLNVYRMYIPFNYNIEQKWKLLVCLHGGNGNSDSVFIRSNQKLQYYAEKYGYILLAPNSYVSGSNYGGVIPPVHMFPEPEVKSEKPEYYPPEVVEENQVAQRYVQQVFDKVFENWNIDREHVFVMGNSMGSCGTFHLLSVWPELFKAGFPTGTMPLTEYLDVEVLKGKTIYFMAGTEDGNDPEDMERRYYDLKEQGLDIQFSVIGGGYHSDAWVMEIQTMFEFFESID